MDKLRDDKYSLAIKKDEEIKTNLTHKKDRLERRKEKVKKDKTSLEWRNEDATKELDDAFKLREYYKNKDTYKKGFLKKAIKFGIKGLIVFGVICSVFIAWVSKIDPSYVLDIKAFIECDLAIGALMGLVEYYSVSREYRGLIVKRSETDNETFITNITTEIEDNKILINEKELKLSDLDVDINDLDLAIDELEIRILEYRTKRNNLIESLVVGLDNHIKGFEYQAFDSKIKKRTKK